MAKISGKSGAVFTDAGFISGIKEWSLTNNYENVDVTCFTEDGDTEARDYEPSLLNNTGTFSGNHTDELLEKGDSVNVYLEVSDAIAYYSECIITAVNPSVAVDGDATNSYSFQSTGKLYVLGEQIIEDYDFSGDGTDWHISGLATYNTSTNNIDFTGVGMVDNDRNPLLDGVTYFTLANLDKYTSGLAQVYLEGTQVSTASSVGYMFGVGKADGTLMGIGASGACSFKSIKVRQVLN